MGHSQRVLRDIDVIKRALLIIWESSKKWTVFNLIMIVIQGLLPLVSLYLLKLIVDSITISSENGTLDSNFEEVTFYIIIWGITSLVTSALGTLMQLVDETQQQSLSDHIHRAIHKKSIGIEYSYYENPAYHDTFHRAQKESAFRPILLLRNLTQATQSGISLAAIFVLLVTFHSMLVVVLIAAVIPLAIVKIKNSKQMYNWFKARTQTERKSHYFSLLLTNKDHAKEIRLFHLGKFYMDKFNKIRKLLLKEKLNLKTKQAKVSLLANSSETLALLGSFIYIGYQGVSGAITIGSLVMFIQAFQKGQQLLGTCIKGLTGVYEQKLFLTNLFDFLDLDSEPSSSGNESLNNIDNSGLKIRDVSFKYPFSDHYAVEGVDLELRKGEMIAIVGENGSGKSTLVKLISRLYEPLNGSIHLNGQPINSVTTEDYQRALSVQFQNFSKYDLTVKENIAGSASENLLNDQRILQSAQYSGAHRFIEHLPEEYNTLLGKFLGKGAELSGGEWQRIALARGFFKETELIILDEPTSFMDGSAETQFLKHLKELKRTKMVIMISHRLSNVQCADRIYVMEQGKVINIGNHKDLTENSPVYANLFSAQREAVN